MIEATRYNPTSGTLTVWHDDWATIDPRLASPMELPCTSEPSTEEAQTLYAVELERRRAHLAELDAAQSEAAFVAEPSPIEAAFVAERDLIKTSCIAYIKEHPECTYEELIAYGQTLARLINPQTLLDSYIANSPGMGLTGAATFEAFRALVLALSPVELMEIK